MIGIGPTAQALHTPLLWLSLLLVMSSCRPKLDPALHDRVDGHEATPVSHRVLHGSGQLAQRPARHCDLGEHVDGGEQAVAGGGVVEHDDVARLLAAEGGLAFIGYSVKPPEASWGLMIAESRNRIDVAWWATILSRISSSEARAVAT